MKKILSILVIISCIITGMPIVKADSDTYTLELKVENNKKAKDFDIFILLPKEYIIYVINQNDLNIAYDGAETLKQNEISGININKNNIQDETYEENGIEYVQIVLEPDESNIYKFEIISNYPYLDMKYRITNEEKDYIAHIDKFKIENNECKMTYDYDKNEIKQTNKIVISPAVIFLIIILILIILIAIISKKVKTT